MDSIERYVVEVLNGLKNGRPAYISDILYGYQKYPSQGTDLDTRIRLLEDHLISQGLVIVVEQGGTNKTQGGYYLVRISSKGLSYFKSIDSDQPTGHGAYYALSTKTNDEVFQQEGLKNVGLLGFVDETNKQGTFPLQHFHLTFPRGQDHFYTLDVANEKFEGRNPVDLGALGFARKTGDSDYYLLHRFFDNKTQNHIYLTNPDLDIIKNLNFRHEYKDNPIYIRRNNISGGLPLYLYSIENVDFFKPIDEDRSSKDSHANENYSPDDFEATFEHLLIVNNVDLSRFSFHQEGEIGKERSITISLNDTAFNFYVNLQKNQGYYTVRRNPEPTDETYIVHDIDRWSEVEKRFVLWISDIKALFDIVFKPTEVAIESPKEAEATSEKKQAKQYLEGATNFEFRNDNIDPVLNVKTQADIFLKIIRSIKNNETGLLMGLFGRWGRGKTFFWKELKKKLDVSKDIEFNTVEFHAWKYQDTPASWAYLYEQFVLCFYDRPRVFACINFNFINRIWLNIIRLGAANLVIGVLWLTLGFVWVFFAGLQFKWNLLIRIVSALGISTIISIIIYYFSYSGRAKDLFKHYWSEVSFKEFLGVQAEIQKELRFLVRAWIAEKNIGKIRLILFVDDIDRCSEDRIIQVIDALKVMIDDRVISDRVIVIAAIDEVVLKRAIKSKYFKSITQDKSLTAPDKEKALNDLCKEYMDKLFISGFKLGNLSKDENEEIFRNLVLEKTFVEVKTDKDSTAFDADTNPPPIQDQSIEASYPPKQTGSPEKSLPELEKPISFSLEKEIMDYELEFLLKAVRKYGNATPRAIRIFYYRYLLAKSFKEILIKSDSDIFREWNLNQEGKTILPLLMIQYSSQKRHEELLKEIERVEHEYLSETAVSVFVLNERFELSSHLYLSLLKIVEIVVPY